MLKCLLNTYSVFICYLVNQYQPVRSILSLSYSQERSRSSEDTCLVGILFKSTPLGSGRVIFHICLYLTSEDIFCLCCLFACFLNKYLLSIYQINVRYFWGHDGNPGRQDSWRGWHLLYLASIQWVIKMKWFSFFMSLPSATLIPFLFVRQIPSPPPFFSFRSAGFKSQSYIQLKTYHLPSLLHQPGLRSGGFREDWVSFSHLLLFLPKEVQMLMWVFVF